MTKELVFSFESPNLDELKRLFDDFYGKHRNNITPEGLRRLLSQSLKFITIYHNGKLIAFGRTLPDSECKFSIRDLIISKDFFKRFELERDIYQLLIRECIRKEGKCGKLFLYHIYNNEVSIN